MSANETSPPPAPPRDALQSQLLPRARLTARDRDALWALLDRYYEQVTRAQFDADLDKKTHVILLRSRRTGELKGFSTLVGRQMETAGRRWWMVFSGDTVIDRAYWGQQALQRRFTRYMLTQRLLHPTQPVYWLLISKGYKTYLLMTRNFLEHWPRHDRPTPPWERAATDHAAAHLFGDAYDPAAGLLRFTGGQRLREGVAPPEDYRGDAPDGRFFLTRNPHHARGDELVCLAPVSLSFLLNFTLRTLRKALCLRPRR
ncbi:MAG: hypothetical protein FJ138_06925 [Deltaproteobacteria bacterium]|nr:hypothetical protein [Deltaproteobacteria bacterium]